MGIDFALEYTKEFKVPVLELEPSVYTEQECRQPVVNRKFARDLATLENPCPWGNEL